MKRRLLPIVVLIGLGFTFSTSTVFADPAAEATKAEATKAEATKAEAAKRFDRALQLFEEGDKAGALAEFKQIYQITQSPVVLYNIGLVYAAMDRPVDAVDALESVTTSDALSAAQREKATSTLEDQKARIGRLSVITVPEGARVDVDNVEVARTPLDKPIRVSEGTHVVSVVATGYVSARKEVVIAGNADATVRFELVAAQTKRMANLSVRTSLDAADVFVDGKKAGTTPLATTLTIPPGNHEVELRRPGYITEEHQIRLGEGATGEVSFAPRIDPSALSKHGRYVALDLSEPNAVVTVDDQQLGPYNSPLHLPVGPHQLRVETDGFLPFEQTVNVGAAGSDVIPIDFVPTPETRAAHDRNVRLHRTWGFIGIGAGAAVAGGGVAWLLVNKAHREQTKKELDQINQQFDTQTGICDIAGGADFNECNARRADAQAAYDDAVAKDLPGYVGIGVGAAIAITGVVILVTGEPSDRFERHRSARNESWNLDLVPGPGQIGSGLRLSF